MEAVQGAERVHLGKAAITSLGGAAWLEPCLAGGKPTLAPRAGHLIPCPRPGGASQGLLLVSAHTVAQLCSWDPYECETSCRNISAREAAVKPQRQAGLQRQAPAPRAHRARLHAQRTGCESQGHEMAHEGQLQRWPQLLLPAARCSSPAQGRCGLWGEAATSSQSGAEAGSGERKAMTSMEFLSQPPLKLPRDGKTQTCPSPYSPGMGKHIPSFPLTSTGMISVPAPPFASPAPSQHPQPSTVPSSKHQAGLGKRNHFSSS